MKHYFNIKNSYLIKSIAIISFILNTNSVFSQNYIVKNIRNNENKINLEIEFLPSYFQLKNNKIYFPNCDDISKPGAPNLPKRLIYIAIPENSLVTKSKAKILKSSEINNIFLSGNSSVKMNSDDELDYLTNEIDKKKMVGEIFPSNIAEVYGYEKIGNMYCVIIELNPYQYNLNKRSLIEIQSIFLELIVDKTLPIKSKQVSTSRNDLSSLIVNSELFTENILYKQNTFVPTSNWIDYSKEYLKFSIQKDGLYKITKNQLDNIGINTTNINPKSFKIYFKGNEIPLFVSGENDEVFNENDFIQFYAKINYGSIDYDKIVNRGEDYKNYYNRYSDSTIIWLTWDGNNGKRINVDTQNYNSNDTLSTSEVKLHLEKDKRLWNYENDQVRSQLPFYQEHKVWTWYNISYRSNVKISFSMNNISDNSEVKITSRLISHASDIRKDAHSFGIAVNSNNIIDSIKFDYTETVNFKNKLESSLFNNGLNYIRIKGMATSASFHQAELDWVDIIYRQNNIAKNDSILMVFSGEGLNKVYNVKINNITVSPSELILYRVEPTMKIIDNFVSSNSNSIVFTDTIYNKAKYLCVPKISTYTPKFIEKKEFKNLKNKSNIADYIIITHSSLKNSVTKYASYITKQYNQKVFTVFVDDIYDEFNYGFISSESIKAFLKNAFLNWSEPKPAYVFLIGDANYDYKNVVEPAPVIRKKNLVPSFGKPVSDTWYVIFEEINETLPQMNIGRLPASSDEEVLRYLSRHKKYNEREFDNWNKRYLLFSGGEVTNSNQFNAIKNANDIINNTIIKPKPVGGISTHFYKTKNPATNFGPYNAEKIAYEIGEGAVFISYIGHSGTQTWDNGITDVSDITNNYDDRFPLISDFGCSTGKFAEPDVDAFSEQSICLDPNGQAITYLGNTSLGYLSTSLTFPKLFYGMIKDTLLTVGEMHRLAKQKMFQESGISEITKLFNYCNNLFGDPIIKLKIPQKPNLTIKKSELDFPSTIDGNLDSVNLRFNIINLGKVTNDSVSIKISDMYKGNEVFSTEIKIPIPLYLTNTKLKIPVSELLGEHKLKIEIDNPNSIDELNETDNVIVNSYTIYSSSLRAIEYNTPFSIFNQSISFLTPSYKQSNNILQIQFSDLETFNNPIEKSVIIDTIITKVSIADLENNVKYYYRLFNPLDNSWSKTNSFKKEESEFNWYFDSSLKNNLNEYENVKFDSSNSGWILAQKENTLKISSAGANDGSFGSMIFNSVESLPNTFYWGLAVAVINPNTLELSNISVFSGPPREPNQDSLISYLSKLPDSTMVAFAIAADAAQTVFGYSAGTSAREIVKEFGSLYIDSLVYRQSWSMIGKKGAPIGSVPESYHKLFEGPASVSISKFISYDKGYLVTPEISNFTKIDNMLVTKNIGGNSSVTVTPIIQNKNNKVDTLDEISLTNGIINFSNLESGENARVKFLVTLSSENSNDVPVFNSIKLSYIGVPELGTNYQVVSIAQDSVEQGENVNLSFWVYNVGESTADSFKVQVDVIKPDNSKEKIFEQLVDSLGSEKRKLFNVSYNTTNFNGKRTFSIAIDSENKIAELYEDNNFYTIPFFVKGDTTKPALNITFDGNDIFDGEYISAQPKIKIELNEPSLVPITDTNSVTIFLNNKLIPYKNNEDVLSINYSQTNPKVIVNYTPTLEDGEYKLKVFGKDASGNVADSSGIDKSFIVQSKAKILDIYNYPNPMTNDTYFTFKLTQVPDEIRIRIFTIAGRMIKEIKLNNSELHYDLNKIYWDGRDADGDEIANGTYLYKVIMSVNGKKYAATKKLAIIK